MNPKNQSDVLLRFSDLKSAGIISNHVTLKRWIEDRGFPPGFWMGPNTHVWWKSEVYEWLVNRPIEREGYDKRKSLQQLAQIAKDCEDIIQNAERVEQ